MRQIGRELNVRYVLEGSMQRGGNRLRVNVQLVDAETGNHIWAERFDKPVADLFDMQDEIVSRLANTLNAQLIAAEARRANARRILDSMDPYFQGEAWLNKGLTPKLAQARAFLNVPWRSIPVMSTRWSARRYRCATGRLFLTDDRAARFAAAEATSTRALSFAPNHALAHCCLALPKSFPTARPRHRRMRTSVSAGSEFGCRSRIYRSRQIFQRAQ